MKTHRLSTSAILAAAALALAGLPSLKATPNFVVAAFATGTQGENNSQDGTYGQYNGDNLSVPYGAGTIWWDGITYDAAAGSTGAAYITANFSPGNNTELLVSMAPGYNNWFFEGPSGSCPTGTVDFSQYSAVQFDILWDTNSDLTIEQFNTGDGWPTNDFTGPVGSNYMATNSYYTAGVNVDLFTGSGGTNVFLGTFQVPANAGTGWQTVTLPYSDSLPGISAGAGLWFQGACGGYSELNGNYNGAFWIDNLILVGNPTVAAPPTLAPPVKAVAGLNIINATEGNSFYDRNEVVATSTSGLSWVGNPGATYSFTLAGYPKVPVGSYSGEAYMFLVPNSINEDNAPDYNESNCLVLEIQTPDNVRGAASLSYKTNMPNGEPPGANQVVYVTSSNLLGTYSLTFTGNDAGYITTPDGTTGAFSLPAGTGATYFAENGSEPYDFLIYIGGQADQASAMDQAVVYGSFTASNVPSASSVNETFIGEPALVNWSSAPTHDAAGVLLVPTNAVYWIDWSLPAGGFTLEDSSTLATNAIWNNVSTFTPIPLYESNAQLIAQSDLASLTNAGYFRLVKRVYTQLQVLLPGQTNAPNTVLGYTGSPTPVSLSTLDGQETITVLAVDANWNPVAVSGDSIQITSSDGAAILPRNAGLVNGSVTFGLSNPFFFQTQGSQTVFATDLANPAIPPGTSAAVTVGP